MTFTLITLISGLSRWENTRRDTSGGCSDARGRKSAEKSDSTWCESCVNQLSQAQQLIVLLCISAAVHQPQSTEELGSVNTTTPVEPAGIGLFKKGLAVEDINHQRRAGSCKKRRWKDTVFELRPNSFCSFVHTALPRLFACEAIWRKN